MIQKMISIICDNCGAGIDHYPDYTVNQALEIGKRHGIVFYKGKHFCNDKCKMEYKDKVASGKGENISRG